MKNDLILMNSNHEDIKSSSLNSPIYHYRNQETKGSTRTKGQVTLTDFGNKIQMYAWFDVRKSGMFGVGKGALAFEMLNSNFTPIVSLTKGLTVGARFPQGTNHKDWDKTIDITGNLANDIRNNGFVCATSISTISDSIGLPSNKAEWKQLISDLTPIIALAYGDYITIGTWMFTKIKQ
ncbi:hypothetical protein [uncultured Tenacibaculum sp.]|uniref:hypothetical protein n=1 Tax=uncultured Tenacibaculum sp. TaxID=174713 RepID=UPI00263843AF|nr:hypothetical protein [uncultured Tenacibaculum sp.]